ncbi:MAG TPA: hypothetical protein VNL97_05555 [Solirubrobacterales bacterium]|nr:hypothetical protein [Solirubrobacterales bacterium]
MHPATPPTDFPIQKPTTDAGKRAAELHQDWSDQFARAGQVEADYVAAQARLKQTEVELVDVLAKRELGEATDADAKAAEDAHAAAKADADAPWQERATAAVSAAEQRRGTYEAFVDENLDELVGELEPDAQAAIDTMRKAAQTLVDGAAVWQESRQRAAHMILPAQGITGQAVPLMTDSANAAVSAAKRLLEDGNGLVLPLPTRRHLDQRRIDLCLPTKRQYVWKDGTGAALPDGGN